MAISCLQVVGLQEPPRKTSGVNACAICCSDDISLDDGVLLLLVKQRSHSLHSFYETTHLQRPWFLVNSLRLETQESEGEAREAGEEVGQLFPSLWLVVGIIMGLSWSKHPYSSEDQRTLPFSFKERNTRQRSRQKNTTVYIHGK